MYAHVCDEEIVHESRCPGSSLLTTEMTVHVTEAPSAKAACDEARWRVTREADGEVESVRRIELQGPPDFDPGTYLVTYEVQTLRYW